MTLTTQEMHEVLEKSSPREIGQAWTDCPSCGAEVEFKIREYVGEVDDTGKLYYDFPLGTEVCECGASLLLVYQYDCEEIYWLNEDSMMSKERRTS